MNNKLKNKYIKEPAQFREHLHRIQKIHKPTQNNDVMNMVRNP